MSIDRAMIISIMIYNESGLLAYEARFERCEINSDLVSGFVTAIHQFGCELFPNNSLCDIVFSNTHMFIEPRQVGGKKLTFLVIHDIYDDQKEIAAIVDALFAEVEEKYAKYLRENFIDSSKLAPLNDFIVKLFAKLKRKENPFACSIDD
ncbi:MAG: hypothetical protein GYA24_18375 [Candidatus Lokiarchaeota archaeon]|nr:hypothetical protein [Candidatus Lokiarchaeota archaeon]